MTPFHLWVANTIAELGGNPAYYLQGLQREQALTYAADRIGACQGGFECFFNDDIQASMRDFAIVPTNLTYLH